MNLESAMMDAICGEIKKKPKLFPFKLRRAAHELRAAKMRGCEQRASNYGYYRSLVVFENNIALAERRLKKQISKHAGKISEILAKKYDSDFGS